MTPEALTLQTSPIITFGYVMQIIFSLAVIVAFIYVIGRFVLPKLKITPTGKIIQVVDRAFLEPQVSAWILKVGKKAWLVVISNKQVAKIDEVEVE
jgi:flagellar biogenesis protein FliO